METNISQSNKQKTAIMTSFKNRFFIVTILIISVMLLNSCDEEDRNEWRSAKIEYPATIPVPPNCVVRSTFDIGSEWIKTDGNIKYGRLDDFRYTRGGYIDIYSGPYIRNLMFSLDHSNVVLPVDVYSNKGGVLRDSDPQVRDFLIAIVELIRRNGYARIYIDGDAENQIDMDFHIYLDAYVIY